MQGLATLLPDIRAIGALIGAPERAERYATALQRRLARVATAVAARPHPRALYLALYGDRLFGAGRDTSYHDVIMYAGLRDAAAEQGLAGWPELTSEQVLAIAPEVLITRVGMGARVCRHPGLDQLAACRATSAAAAHMAGPPMIELDGALLDDPGPSVLDAAEALYTAYWQR
jgi:iron complex transport system substrate-binding protein